MPTSHHGQINQVLECVINAKPHSILDIGVGFGKFGFLLREYLELWDGREQYDTWVRRIVGVEAFEEYITTLQEMIYDQIYVGDACSILPQLETEFDLALLIDVLEHFERDKGIEILQQCSRLALNTIVSTPKDIGHQGASFGNPYEIHRTQWCEDDFKHLENASFLAVQASIVCCFGKDARRIIKQAHNTQMTQSIYVIKSQIRFRVNKILSRFTANVIK